MFLKVVSAVLVTIAILGLTPAFAKEEPLKIKICSHYMPPHSYAGNDGKAIGFASEVLSLIAKELHWQLDTQFTTWTRLKLDAESGRCDLAYVVQPRPELETLFTYPEQGLPELRQVLIVKKGKNISFDGHLGGFMLKYSIGITKGNSVNTEFADLRKEKWARIEEFQTSDSLFSMLLSGKLSAALEDQQVALFELTKLGKLDQVEILSPVIVSTPAYFAFARKGRALELMEQFDTGFEKVKKSKDYKDLLKKYSYPQ